MPTTLATIVTIRVSLYKGVKMLNLCKINVVVAQQRRDASYKDLKNQEHNVKKAQLELSRYEHEYVEALRIQELNESILSYA